jgi:hypothetical protein
MARLVRYLAPLAGLVGFVLVYVLADAAGVALEIGIVVGLLVGFVLARLVASWQEGQADRTEEDGRGGTTRGRYPVFSGRPRFGTGRSIASGAVLLVLLGAYVLIRGEQYAFLWPFLVAFGVALAAEMVVAARRWMERPLGERCSVCGRPKPRGLKSLPDDESALGAYWRECPSCHAHYCDDHKGLLWVLDGEHGAGLVCPACGWRWTVVVPSGGG